jgi:outer membrane protein assembly factor BamB
MFGLNASHSGTTNETTGITAANVSKLHHLAVKTPGVIDSSPILSSTTAFATTIYGKTIAVDLTTGKINWTFTPSSFSRLVGTAQFTQSSPALDPSGDYVYAASPDGFIHKLDVTNGSEAAGWPVSVTADARHEKLASGITVAAGRVIIGMSGYIGDVPPYQGKVVTIDAATGSIDHVFNVLCSDRHAIFDPSTCSSTDGGIWARAGIVVDPTTGDLLVATSNGGFDGATNWGDSVLELTPDAGTLLAHWTPSDEAKDNVDDIDVGSTAPALLTGGLALQGGKDAKLHLIDIAHLASATGPGATQLGGDVQIMHNADKQRVFSQPAVLYHGGSNLVYVSTIGATTAYELHGRTLKKVWGNKHTGTSPVVAGGLVYVYDQHLGKIRIYAPKTGKSEGTLSAGTGHWTSLAIANGHIAVGQGSADNRPTGSGILNLWSVKS